MRLKRLVLLVLSLTSPWTAGGRARYSSHMRRSEESKSFTHPRTSKSGAHSMRRTSLMRNACSLLAPGGPSHHRSVEACARCDARDT